MRVPSVSTATVPASSNNAACPPCHINASRLARRAACILKGARSTGRGRPWPLIEAGSGLVEDIEGCCGRNGGGLDVVGVAAVLRCVCCPSVHNESGRRDEKASHQAEGDRQ